MSTLKTCEEIVEREFRRASGIDGDIKVVFTEDETIEVSTACKEFVMEIGSDDDEFVFINEDSGEIVRFEYPPDWPEAV